MSSTQAAKFLDVDFGFVSDEKAQSTFYSIEF